MNQVPEKRVEEIVEEFASMFKGDKDWFMKFDHQGIALTDWLRTTLHHQLQKAREEEREKIAEMLSKAGDNKISMLDDDNFTGTYWISLNDAYRLLTGRQVNHDWEQGKIEKNATVEMVIRKSINPDHSELDQDKTNGL